MPSFDADSQAIPWIEREEDDIEAETQKILGRLAGDAIEADSMRINVEGMRLPALDSYMETVSVELGVRVSTEQITETLREFSGARQAFPLPSAPTKPIVVHGERDRPQPPLDTDGARGTVVHVGSLGKCSVLDYKFVIFRHNTIRGDAGAALLNAELIDAPAGKRVVALYAVRLQRGHRRILHLPTQRKPLMSRILILFALLCAGLSILASALCSYVC